PVRDLVPTQKLLPAGIRLAGPVADIGILPQRVAMPHVDDGICNGRAARAVHVRYGEVEAQRDSFLHGTGAWVGADVRAVEPLVDEVGPFRQRWGYHAGDRRRRWAGSRSARRRGRCRLGSGCARGAGRASRRLLVVIAAATDDGRQSCSSDQAEGVSPAQQALGLLILRQSALLSEFASSYSGAARDDYVPDPFSAQIK